MALKEIGVTGGQIEMDHHNGQSWHKDVGTVPIVFPMTYVTRINEMDKAKTQNFFFQGVITERRAWLREYENVSESQYGRKPETKYSFHKEYYARLCKSRFALAPTGDCPWSYRFFEGVMCHSMPVIGDEDVDVFSNGFAFQRHSDEKKYDFNICTSNYQVFLKRHTLRGLGFS
jgi:hypothetical protein